MPTTHQPPPPYTAPHLKVSIAHLLRYFWGAALGIAPLVLVTACAFDFYDISKSACVRMYYMPACLYMPLCVILCPCRACNAPRTTRMHKNLTHNPNKPRHHTHGT